MGGQAAQLQELMTFFKIESQPAQESAPAVRRPSVLARNAPAAPRAR
jgi:hypothetical protein